MRARQQKDRFGPMLLGKPSPSLVKMDKMNVQELAVQIQSLSTEKERLKRRIEHLKIQDPVPDRRIDLLSRQVRRLSALERSANEKLAQIQES